MWNIYLILHQFYYNTAVCERDSSVLLVCIEVLLICILFVEIMDFGYPQNLSPEILKLYITQEGVRSPFSSKVR